MATHAELVEEMVNERVWAVVGASNDPRKYGNKIFKNLLAAGYHVYPVNPKGGEIDGLPVYASLGDLPQRPAVVDIVVPPPVTEQIVRQMRELGLERAWMQPGAESQAAIAFCQASGIKLVYDDCAMVQRKEWTSDDAPPQARDMEGVFCPMPER